MLNDYKGVSDPDLEMQYIELQLVTWIERQPIDADDERINRSLAMTSRGFTLPLTAISLPPTLRQRAVIDRLAKLVAKHGFEAECDIIDKVRRNRICDPTLK
jgi:hypothetical protein